SPAQGAGDCRSRRRQGARYSARSGSGSGTAGRQLSHCGVERCAVQRSVGHLHRRGSVSRVPVLPEEPGPGAGRYAGDCARPAPAPRVGMGDALATWFEAKTCVEGCVQNMRGGASTQSALALAKLCYETLLEDGIGALRAAQMQTVTPALE